MADVFREVDEALREDRARVIWKRYGTLIIAAALAIVMATAGFVFWRNYQAGQNAQHTAALATAIALAEDEPEAAMDALAGIAEDAGGDHAMLARFYEAGLHAEDGDVENALQLYRQIADDGAVDEMWRQLATLLSVMHRVDGDDPATLEAELAPLMADANPWRHSARELAGVLALRRDDRDRAIELFGGLAADPATPEGVRGRASDMLAWLEE